MEFMLCRRFLDMGKPVMGIGRGMEIINVALGGTLCRDIEKASYEKHTDGIEHPVTIVPGTGLRKILDDVEMVNSYHHLAPDKLGRGLTASAVTGGGVIEAIEHEDLPVLGVLWHPERMRGDIPEPPEGPDMTCLFKWFIELC